MKKKKYKKYNYFMLIRKTENIEILRKNTYNIMVNNKIIFCMFYLLLTRKKKCQNY